MRSRTAARRAGRAVAGAAPASEPTELAEALLDRQAVHLVDGVSPQLLQLAVFFAPNREVAQRMVVRAWSLLLRERPEAGAPAEPAARRTRLVRALGEGDPDDPEVSTGARALQAAVGSAGCYVPHQAGPGVRRVPATASTADRLRALPGALRLVLLLTDVQHWSPREVEDLLELRPRARRVLLAHARDALSCGLGQQRVD